MKRTGRQKSKRPCVEMQGSEDARLQFEMEASCMTDLPAESRADPGWISDFSLCSEHFRSVHPENRSLGPENELRLSGETGRASIQETAGLCVWDLLDGLASSEDLHGFRFGCGGGLSEKGGVERVGGRGWHAKGWRELWYIAGPRKRLWYEHMHVTQNTPFDAEQQVTDDAAEG